MHQLGEYSEQLTDNINNIVNHTRRKIKEIDPKQKVTSETKQLCDLILTMVKCAQEYMRNVDGFAWHGKHDGKQESALQSIDEQENLDFRPLNKYIGELLQCLNRAYLSYEPFLHASSSLDSLLNQLKMKEDNAQASEDNSNRVGRYGVLGAIGGGAVTVSIGVVTGGIGIPVLLVGAASAMSAGVAGVAYTMAAEFRDKKEAYINLAKHTRTIQASATRMQQIVMEINKSLEDIGTKVDSICGLATGYGNLLEALKQLFTNMDELGEVSSKCCKVLKILEADLNRSVHLLRSV